MFITKLFKYGINFENVDHSLWLPLILSWRLIFLVPNGCSFSSMKSAPHQASYTSTLDHLHTNTLKRERKGGEALSFFATNFPSFMLNECTHVYSEEGGRKGCPKDDEAYNVHLLCILRHWYRYTIEQSLEKNNNNEIYSIKVKC
jgi:hypothetical protein